MNITIDADVFLFDLDGTIYLGDVPIPGAIETVKYLESLGKRVFFLTNNSGHTGSEYVKKLAKLGYLAQPDQIISSGDATIWYLKSNRSGKSVFPLATKTFTDELKKNSIPISKEADIVLLAFDTTITYEKIWHANILLSKGCEFITTHGDLVCPSEFGNMPDVGSLTALFTSSSGRKPDVICGKPYSIMAELINQRIKNVSLDRVLMIGDRLYTDILFGIKNGYRSVVVLTGETSSDVLDRSDIKPDHIFNSVNDLVQL
ncbi:MAG: HAD-IIA family hydrolase [Christensenellaceae bacterium]|nr:HAD-IIA family hydrolase [Christensenellaceae bacterium]